MKLDWPDCRNVRDVGGLPVADGQRIRRGALIRSDRLDQLTEPGRQAVRAYGVSRILDLRRADECQTAPNPFTADPMYLNLPVQDPSDVEARVDGTLVEFYLHMLDHGQRLFAGAVAAVAEAPPGGVIVHCHAGKDRTGLVVALALTLAGVAPGVIADDYAYSEVGLADANAEVMATVTDERERPHLRELWSARPDTITAALTHLHARYGGVAEYLKAGGLTDNHAAAIRRSLIA